MLTKPQSSRRTRITASIAAVALGVVSMGLATGIAEAAVTPASNPDLTAGCGSDIVLILDDSNSVWNTQSRKDAVADAAQAFADGFRDTNSTLGVVRFNTTAATVSAPVPLTGSAYANLDDTYLTGARPNGSANGVGQGATNWEAAFSTANSQVSANGSRPKLVVMITDGQPTVSSDSGNGSDFSNGALDDGITQANVIKGKGAHILTVGVGNAFTNDTYKNALTKISGTDVFPAAAWPTGQGYNRQATFVAAGANTTDSVLVTDFANLASQVRAIAEAACQGSLTIQKKVVNAQGQTITSGALVDGWSFSATRPNSGYAWVTPNSGGAETRSSVTGQGGNLNGIASFQWNITGSNGNVAVTETVKDGYVLDSVVCDGQNVTVSNNGFSIGVAKTASVSCVVTNKEQKRIDLELDKTIVGSAPYSVDTDRTWKLSVTNKGPADATGVVVKDYVPAGFAVNTGALPAAASLSGSTITWNVGNVAKDQTKTLDILGTLTQTGSITNWAQVTSANEVDTDSTPNNCTISNGVLGTAEDDCDKVTINVTRDYNLDIDKVRVGSGAVGVGDQVQYDLKVKNLGASTAAAGFVVTDQVNAGLTNVSVSANSPGAANWNCSATVGNAVSCTYGATLAKDSTVSVRVTATVGASLADAQSVPNTACVKKGANSTTNDDCDDETIDLTPRSDLETTKTATTPSVVTGGAATWKYSVKNLGPSVKKSAFTVTDTLPNGLTNVSISGGAGWVCSTSNIAGPTSSSSFTCTFTPGVNGLAVNASTTDVTVTGSTAGVVPAQGSSSKLDNKACVADGFNETTGKTGNLEGPNDCSTATVTVTPKVDLKMNKGVDVESGAVVGDTLTYSFSVTNKGPSAATVIGFTDTFDAGLTDLVLQPTGVNWDCSLVGQALSCDWKGGSLAKNATTAPSVTVTAKVGAALADATDVKNTACVKVDDIEGQEANDCDTTTTELDPKYTLVIDKNQVEDNPVAVGGTVNYELTVYNQGPSKATSGFVVTDAVPSLLTVTSATSDNNDWNCTATTGNQVSCTWEGADLAVGAAPRIVVTATVNAEAANADAVFNTACVAKDGDQPEGDKRVALVIDEGDEVLTECDTVTTEFPKGALSVGKAAFLNDDETVGGEGTTLEGFGGTITYVLGVSASGNLDQANVVVSDTVPTIGTPAGNQLNTTLVSGSVVCVDGPNGATNNEIPCAGPVDSTPNDLSWNVGTVTAGTTKWVEFKVTVDVPAVDQVDENATSFNVKNVGAATSDYTKDPVPSNEVDTPVEISRVIPNDDATCTDDTPLFGVDGEGFYAGETVKMRVFDKDGNLVSDEYATAVADANGDVTFSNIAWPGFSVTQPGNIKTYPGPEFANIQVELYGSPTSNKVTIGYPPAESGCVANLEIEKSNNPTSEVTITEFGAEITYTMDVTAPEQNVYNSEDVVVTDVLPGYGTLASGTVSYKAASATCDAPIAALGADSFCTPSYNDGTKTVTWLLGDMRPGDTRQVSFVVTVDIQETEGNTVADFSIFNEATVDSAYTDPTDSNVVENPVLVELTKGIEITKTASNNPGGDIADANFFSTVAGVVGEKTTFRFDVTNNSATPVSDLVLTDDNLRFAANAGAANLEDGGTPYVDSSLIENCRVGLTDDAADGFGAAFTLGSAIPGVTLDPKQSVALYCDITVPVIEPESLYATDGNRIFNDASISGTAKGLGAVENDSNVASIVLFAEKLDIFPIKSIVDEDGTNPRGFDNLGKITEPTLKTFDMTIDNVSDTAYEVNLYDYFLNASPGLTKAQRDAIFDNMVCLDFDLGGDFPTPADFASGSEFFNQFAPNDNESTTFGPATDGKGAGTFLARSAAPLLITPGDGYEVVCQTTLPEGDYSLTNAFRMVANPVQVEVDEEVVARQAAAATGSLDVIATAGVVVGVPSEGGGGEEEQPGETPEPAVKGVKLPNTGLEIPVGTLMAIGIALVGAGILLGLTARRRDNAGESI